MPNPRCFRWAFDESSAHKMFFCFIVISTFPFGRWDGKVVAIGTTGLDICHVAAKCDTTLIQPLGRLFWSRLEFHMQVECTDAHWFCEEGRKKDLVSNVCHRPKWFYCWASCERTKTNSIHLNLPTKNISTTAATVCFFLDTAIF